MVVGGSVAYGWKDPNNDSYLRRAFQSLSDESGVQYNYDNRCVIGGTPSAVDLSGDYTNWLTSDKPNIVVIAWGLENDAGANRSSSEIEQEIHTEISEALADHAVVIVASPPVTEATATTLHRTVEEYIADEKADVESFHSPNAYFINLNTIMEKYLEEHNQSWQDYYGDSWHPNEAGHILAGSLLYNQLLTISDHGLITWKTSSTTSGGGSSGT